MSIQRANVTPRRVAACLGVAHLVAWGVSVFGGWHVGGHWAILLFYAARCGDGDLVIDGVLYTVVPSLVIGASGWIARRWSLAYPALMLSFFGWARYAMGVERGWPVQLTWLPYWIVLMATIFYAWPGSTGRFYRGLEPSPQPEGVGTQGSQKVIQNV